MLRRVGTALHVTHTRNLVARLSGPVPLYIPLYTYSLKKVGTLYDVIGPTSNPYGLVRPVDVETARSLVGEALYARTIDLERKARPKRR